MNTLQEMLPDDMLQYCREHRLLDAMLHPPPLPLHGVGAPGHHHYPPHPMHQPMPAAAAARDGGDRRTAAVPPSDAVTSQG